MVKRALLERNGVGGATQLAQAQHSKSPIADVVAQLFVETKNAGFGDRNIVAVKRAYD